MHVYLMYWSPKPSHKFEYGAWKLSSLETLSKYTTNYRQPLTITLLTLMVFLLISGPQQTHSQAIEAAYSLVYSGQWEIKSQPQNQLKVE